MQAQHIVEKTDSAVYWYVDTTNALTVLWKYITAQYNETKKEALWMM